MRKTCWLCFFLLLNCFVVQAQQEKEYLYQDTVEARVPAEDRGTTVVEAPQQLEETEIKSVESATDTTLQYSNLHISADSVQRLKMMGSLAYARYLDSLLKAAEEDKKAKAGTQRRVKMPSMSFGFLTPVLWILAIAFVLFILYTLFLRDGAFRRNSKKATLSNQEAPQEEVKPGSDMDRLIRQALQSRNYRMAIRYQYLNSLYKLAEKGLVQFAVDKTNYQYVSELTKQEQRNEFAKLTLHYEYVWYGEFEIDETVYKKLEPGFTAFYNKI